MSRIENNIEKKAASVERYKNPWFWVGIGGILLTSLQVEASSLTTWASVGELVIKTVSNPFLLGTTAMAVLVRDWVINFFRGWSLRPPFYFRK